jgi:predicted nucleotidyltransferase component of viral defense system
MDLPSVFKEMREGILIIPYSSSILSVETPEEILTDKLRALFERPYLKGRDLFDLWFLHTLFNTQINLSDLDQKLKSYVRPFRPARKASFFLKKENDELVRQTLQTDLRPFLPSLVYEEMERSGFTKILSALEKILQPLVKEGLDEMIASHG